MILVDSFWSFLLIVDWAKTYLVVVVDTMSLFL